MNVRIGIYVRGICLVGGGLEKIEERLRDLEAEGELSPGIGRTLWPRSSRVHWDGRNRSCLCGGRSLCRRSRSSGDV